MRNDNKSSLRLLLKYLRVLYIALFLITANSVYASIPPVKNEKKVTSFGVQVYTEPEFPGGEAELNKYLEDNIIYPIECAKNKIEGDVTVKFHINIDGSILEFRIMRGVHPLLDAEAIRVIARMPKWKPALKYENIIKAETTLTVNFSLNKEKDTNGKVMQKERVTASEKCLDEVLETVEKEPEFPGGMQALVKYIVQNVNYPYRPEHMHGRIIINFIIHKDGSVSNIKIERGMGLYAWQNEEAIRVIATMPKWIPGENKGKAVNVWHSLPIVFKLQ